MNDVPAMNSAYLWARAWYGMAAKSMDHLASLDPRTDKLAILRWHGRWLRSRRKYHAALERFALAAAAEDPARLPN